MKLYLALFLALISAVVVSSWGTSYARCPKPAIQYGFIRKGRRNAYTSGRKIVIACRSGYELIGHSRVKCLSSGYWSPKLPHCRKRTTSIMKSNNHIYLLLLQFKLCVQDCLLLLMVKYGCTDL